jgi:REP element-mobilizing transposase RayT
MAGLFRSAQSKLKGEPVWLCGDYAALLPAQFMETATFRGWSLLAAAIMANHVHLVVGVPGDPDPADLLRDFKAYGARALNRRFGKPASGTWWTQSGSRRKLPDHQAVCAAINYVQSQANPLEVWIEASMSPASGGR